MPWRAGSRLHSTQCTKLPLTGASGSSTSRTSAAVPSGTPSQIRAGDRSPCSWSKRAGIGAPDSNAGLCSVSVMSILPVWWSLRRGGQQCLCFADEACRIYGTEEAEGTPELFISLGPPPGPRELLGGAKPREGGRPGCAHRVQRPGGRHEVLVSQPSGGYVPER